jgi:hypothetical protein
MRIFIVVAKDRPDLFNYFTAAFAGVDGVQVIGDRRLASETQVATGPASGHGERRATPDIYDELEERGFVIVRVPA